MTELEIFVADCQTVAQEAIGRLESEMLSSWSSVLTSPDFNYGTYSFDLPTLPAIPEFNIESSYAHLNSNMHTDHVWSSGESKYLWEQIRNAFISGGVGITKSLQTAIFQSDRERKLQTLNDSLDAVNAGLGARGFSVPSNLLTGARNEVIVKYQSDLENQSREITKLMEEHARINWQFCVERGISLEQFHSDFTTKYDALYLDMIKTSVDKYRTDVQIELDSYRSQLEGINSRLQIAKNQADVNTAALSAELEKAKIELDLAKSRSTLQVQAHSSEVSRLNAAYGAYVEAVGHYAKTASGGLLTVQTRKLT